MLQFKFEYHPGWLAKTLLIVGPTAAILLVGVIAPFLETRGVSTWISLTVGIATLLPLTIWAIRKYRHRGQLILDNDKLQLILEEQTLDIPFSDLKQIKESGIWMGYYVDLITQSNIRHRVHCVQHLFTREEDLIQAVKHLRRSFDEFEQGQTHR